MEKDDENDHLIRVKVQGGGSAVGRSDDAPHALSSSAGVSSNDVKYLKIDDAVEALGWGPYQWQMLFQCGGAWACDSMEMMLLGFLVPRLVPVLRPDASPKEMVFLKFLIGAVTFLGMWAGCLVIARIGDIYGRKKAYFLTTSIVATFGMICAFSQSISMFIMLRFIVGFGLGGGLVAITLFSELLGSKYRGSAIILAIGILWTIGTMLEIVFAWLCLSVKDNNWRMLLVLSSVPSFVLLSVIPWLDESPRYYMITNQVEKAVEVLKKASRRNGGKLPKNFKLHKLPQKPRNQHAFFKTLLNDKYRLTSSLLWGLWFCSVICYYGLSFVTPLYFAYQNRNEYFVTFVSAMAEIPGLIVTSQMVDRLGRKKTKGILYLLCGIFTMLLSFSSLPYSLLVISAIVARGSMAGAFDDLYVYTPEVYPTQVRAFGLGVCSAVARVAGIVVSYLSFRNTNGSQAAGAVFIYALCAFTAALLSTFLPYETMGAALQDEEDGDEDRMLLQ